MYDVYVTSNQTEYVYVRLKPQELSSVNPKFHEELHSLVRQGKMDKSDIQTFLVRWGFRLILPRETVSFATAACSSSGGTLMYASLYAQSELWAMDEEVDFHKFGCLLIRRDYKSSINSFSFSFRQVNPEPVWIGAHEGDNIPTNAIKSSSGLQVEYFGRLVNGVPCGVSVTPDNKCSEWNSNSRYELLQTSGEILQATGHQLYRVKSGDPIPPNAVIVGVSGTEGSLYLGRVGGKIPCSVSTEDGKIKKFFYLTGDKTDFESSSGEILVLTKGTAA
ncbi:hypothetical protein ABFA07_002645 [Porites harrisoni]